MFLIVKFSIFIYLADYTFQFRSLSLQIRTRLSFPLSLYKSFSRCKVAVFQRIEIIVSVR